MKVLGKNVILKIFDDIAVEWKPVYCALDITLSISTTTVGTAISGAGLWDTVEASRLSWTASVNGLVNIIPNILDPSVFEYIRLQELQISLTKLQLRFERTSGQSMYINTGYAIITDSSDTGSYNGLDTYSITLKGSGPLELEKL